MYGTFMVPNHVRMYLLDGRVWLDTVYSYTRDVQLPTINFPVNQYASDRHCLLSCRQIGAGELVQRA